MIKRFREILHDGITPSQRRMKILRSAAEVVAKGMPSHHSSMGSTLCYILHHLEVEGIPYTLKAVPGKGYTVKANPELE